MIPKVGKSGSDIPVETQLLLLEAREDSALNNETTKESAIDNTSYILLLPVLDGEFRTSCKGCSTNELQFCIESGDPNVQSSQTLEAVFVNSAYNPFELIKESIKILENHKGTFIHIDGKKIPANLDWFGWCTWDAFYTDVIPQGIIEGLQSLPAGGCPARFLIIDDGWQDTVNELLKEGELLNDGVQFATRLVDIKENKKFKNIKTDGTDNDLHGFIKYIKETYRLKYNSYSSWSTFNSHRWRSLLGY